MIQSCKAECKQVSETFGSASPCNAIESIIAGIDRDDGVMRCDEAWCQVRQSDARRCKMVQRVREGAEGAWWCRVREGGAGAWWCRGCMVVHGGTEGALCCAMLQRVVHGGAEVHVGAEWCRVHEP